MHRRRAFRGWAILWAVLQFALPASASLADAQLESESIRGPGAHVESSTGAACRPAHTAECALCQFLSHATGVAASSNLTLAVSEARFAAPAAAERRPVETLRHLAPARGPPALSA